MIEHTRPKTGSNNMQMALVNILSEEIIDFTDDSFDVPFEHLRIDSFGLIALRMRIEKTLGITIRDDKWTALRTPGDLSRLVADLSSTARGAAPAQDGNRISHRQYTLNMPQMALGGLAESWLFKEVGDLHWGMITDGLQTPSSRLTDSIGDRLYATFTRFQMRSTHPLSDFEENDPLSMQGDISRYGAGIFMNDISLESRSKQINIKVMSSFTKRGEPGANSGLLKGQPTIPTACPIKSLDEMPIFGEEYRQRRNTEPAQTLFECDYNIIPYHDINGVGLLYFAAYPAITDICELKYINKGNAWSVNNSVISRDIYYFANSNIDDTLIYRVHSHHEADSFVEIESSISRATDQKTMAYVKTRKAPLNG